jgi:hypothetical protein
LPALFLLALSDRPDPLRDADVPRVAPGLPLVPPPDLPPLDPPLDVPPPDLLPPDPVPRELAPSDPARGAPLPRDPPRFGVTVVGRITSGDSSFS